jgi:hypothetical protein
MKSPLSKASEEYILPQWRCPNRNLSISLLTACTAAIGKRIQGVRTTYGLDARFRVMDTFGEYAQVLSLGLPSIQ